MKNEDRVTASSSFSILLTTAMPARPIYAVGVAQESLPQSTRLYTALVYGVILLVIFAFGLWALSRLSRRYQAHLRQKPAERTPVPDIWSMHRPPEEPDGGAAEEDPTHER